MIGSAVNSITNFISSFSANQLGILIIGLLCISLAVDVAKKGISIICSVLAALAVLYVLEPSLYSSIVAWLHMTFQAITAAT